VGLAELEQLHVVSIVDISVPKLTLISTRSGHTYTGSM